MTRIKHSFHNIDPSINSTVSDKAELLDLIYNLCNRQNKNKTLEKDDKILS